MLSIFHFAKLFFNSSTYTFTYRIHEPIFTNFPPYIRAVFAKKEGSLNIDKYYMWCLSSHIHIVLAHVDDWLSDESLFPWTYMHMYVYTICTTRMFIFYYVWCRYVLSVTWFWTIRRDFSQNCGPKTSEIQAFIYLFAFRRLTSKNHFMPWLGGRKFLQEVFFLVNVLSIPDKKKALVNHDQNEVNW